MAVLLFTVHLVLSVHIISLYRDHAYLPSHSSINVLMSEIEQIQVLSDRLLGAGTDWPQGSSGKCQTGQSKFLFMCRITITKIILRASRKKVGRCAGLQGG